MMGAIGAGNTGAMPIGGMMAVPPPGNTMAPPASTAGGGGMAGGAVTTPGGMMMTPVTMTAGSGGMDSAAGGDAPTAGSGGEMPDEMPDEMGMGGDPKEPIIPEVSGECPEFTTGTKTIGGLGGIAMQAGPKGSGDGSLIFYWHGTGSSSFEVGNIPPAATQEILGAGGVIVAFGPTTGTGGDCSGTGTFGKDDFKIADLITACAVKNHNINPKRIYTTGCSAGGLMAGCMGIQRSNYIAASAPNSGGVTIGYGMMQDPTRVPAVMTMHGGPGDMVIVAFAQTSEAYDNYMLRAGSAMVINCNHGGTHCGASPSLQSAAWQFMKDHPFGTKPSPYAGGLPDTFPSYCEIHMMTDRLPIGEGTMGGG